MRPPEGAEHQPPADGGCRSCRACDLWREATQTVFGEGPSRHLMMVGEQPGDQEDRAGRPFVGPAGRMLDRARRGRASTATEVYMTNAVKHFKRSRAASGRSTRGRSPSRSWPASRGSPPSCGRWRRRCSSCSAPWRQSRCSGPDSASPSGEASRWTDQHPLRFAIATLHPSSILRSDPGQREQRLSDLVADLEQVPALSRRRR